MATLIYSINQEIIANENSTDTLSISDLVSLSPSMILLRKSWPISDKEIKNTTVDDGVYSEAAEMAKRRLKEKDELEKSVPSLKLTSPSYRHQKVTATSEKGRNISRLGYLEEYAMRHIYR